MILTGQTTKLSFQRGVLHFCISRETEDTALQSQEKNLKIFTKFREMNLTLLPLLVAFFIGKCRNAPQKISENLSFPSRCVPSLYDLCEARYELRKLVQYRWDKRQQLLCSPRICTIHCTLEWTLFDTFQITFRHSQSLMSATKCHRYFSIFLRIRAPLNENVQAPFQALFSHFVCLLADLVITHVRGCSCQLSIKTIDKNQTFPNKAKSFHYL